MKEKSGQFCWRLGLKSWDCYCVCESRRPEGQLWAKSAIIAQLDLSVSQSRGYDVIQSSQHVVGVRHLIFEIFKRRSSRELA